MNNNSKKATQLKMSPGKARFILQKKILFMLVKKTNMDDCYRCKKKIKNIEDLSIEHKEHWLDSEDPVKLFFDLDNIAFSHKSCNYKSKRHNIEKARETMLKNNWKGENHPNCKLSEKKVLEIRELLRKGETLRNIGTKYNISHRQVWTIKHKLNWK